MNSFTRNLVAEFVQEKTEIEKDARERTVTFKREKHVARQLQQEQEAFLRSLPSSTVLSDKEMKQLFQNNQRSGKKKKKSTVKPIISSLKDVQQRYTFSLFTIFIWV